jgi:hypothetical protein
VGRFLICQSSSEKHSSVLPQSWHWHAVLAM